jgi:hypothetical protein
MFVKPDLSTFPELRYGRAWFHLDEDLVKAMQPLCRALTRAQNAVRFAWFSEGDAELMRCRETEAHHLREGFLRAALAEFVSMEDVLKLDLSTLGISAPPLRLNQTPKPILHLFRELRNHEIHLRQSSLSVTQKDALWGHIERPAEARPLRISIWTLEGVTFESFLELRNARLYTKAEISCFVGWFNKGQAAWGIQQLLLIAIEEYCRELVHAYLAART